jgi:hypothetical protein
MGLHDLKLTIWKLETKFGEATVTEKRRRLMRANENKMKTYIGE